MAKLHDLHGSNGLELIEATPTQDLQFNTLDYILCTKKWLENIGCFAFMTTDELFCEQVWSLHFYVLKNVTTFYVHNFKPLALDNQQFVH
jgi:hypothetical protein